MIDNFDIKITKRQLLNYINNDMTTNYYYLVNLRIYNQNKTRYKQARMVVFFDSYDLTEYYNRAYTKEDIKNYVDEIVASNCMYIDNYNNLTEFYKICNQTIIDYNNYIKKCNYIYC